VEVLDRSALSREWLAAIVQVLRRHPGWAVGVKNIKGGYLLIFANRLLVTGPSFAGCNDLRSVVKAASRNLHGVSGE